MPTTPSFALAHTFLPNLVKLKGGAAVINALEGKERHIVDAVWTQAHVSHVPQTRTVLRDPYRIGVLTLPPPKEIGEAFMVGIVVSKADAHLCRYFMLEHDYVLAKKTNRTLLCEREGAKHTKHGDGPVLTNQVDTDIAAFIAAFMELVHPTKIVDANRSYR